MGADAIGAASELEEKVRDVEVMAWAGAMAGLSGMVSGSSLGSVETGSVATGSVATDSG